MVLNGACSQDSGHGHHPADGFYNTFRRAGILPTHLERPESADARLPRRRVPLHDCDGGDCGRCRRPRSVQGRRYWRLRRRRHAGISRRLGTAYQISRRAPGFQLSELQLPVRATVTNVSANTVTLSATGLSQQTGTYVGGAIIGTLNVAPWHFDTTKIARIASYAYQTSPPSVQVTFSIPSGASQPNFANSDVVFLSNPDPFDPAEAYPQIYVTNTSAASFATYPLIYSAGPDKAYGIVAENDNSPISYATNSYNPFPFITGDMPVDLCGNANTINEPNSTPNAWNDNIHNHLQGLR